jgi:hypothetical protein
VSVHTWETANDDARCSCCAAKLAVMVCARCHTSACIECRRDGEAQTAGACAMCIDECEETAEQLSELDGRLLAALHMTDAPDMRRCIATARSHMESARLWLLSSRRR